MMAAVNLQRDAGLMMSNLQILAQFVTALHRMSSEMMLIGVGHVVFPTEDVADLSMTPRASAQVHDSNGPLAPSVGSGCSRANTSIILYLVHALLKLFSGETAASEVVLLKLIKY